MRSIKIGTEEDSTFTEKQAGSEKAAAETKTEIDKPRGGSHTAAAPHAKTGAEAG